MATKVFINLPVKDLNRSKTFFEGLTTAGCTNTALPTWTITSGNLPTWTKRNYRAKTLNTKY